MHTYAGRVLWMFILLGVFTACASGKAKSENGKLAWSEGASQPLSSYILSLPAGWNEVTDHEQIKTRVFWTVGNYNYTRWLEKPQIRAWDGPEEMHTFLTVQQIKRQRNLGIGTWYEDVIRFMHDLRADVQETGVSEINGLRCKWWVQSFLEGQVYQQCFMFGRGAYFYICCFTTSYLSEDKKQFFENIVKTVAFNDCYTEDV